MKEKKINNKYRTVLLTAIALSFCFPAGVVITVLSAINSMFILMALGIVMVVAGFFVSPCIWSIFFPGVKFQRDVYNLIAHGDCMSVSEIANNTGKSRASVLSAVRALISGGYFKGYSLLPDNERIENKVIKKEAAAKEMSVAVCPGCGAKTKVTGGNGTCQYCGLPVSAQK